MHGCSAGTSPLLGLFRGEGARGPFLLGWESLEVFLTLGMSEGVSADVDCMRFFGVEPGFARDAEAASLFLNDVQGPIPRIQTRLLLPTWVGGK